MTTEDKGMPEVAAMDRAINCLYLEVPAAIANDIKNRWDAAKAALSQPSSPIQEGEVVYRVTDERTDYCLTHYIEDKDMEDMYVYPVTVPSSLLTNKVSDDVVKFLDWTWQNGWFYDSEISGYHWKNRKTGLFATAEELHKLYKSSQTDAEKEDVRVEAVEELWMVITPNGKILSSFIHKDWAQEWKDKYSNTSFVIQYSKMAEPKNNSVRYPFGK